MSYIPQELINEIQCIVPNVTRRDIHDALVFSRCDKARALEVLLEASDASEDKRYLLLIFLIRI